MAFTQTDYWRVYVGFTPGYTSMALMDSYKITPVTLLTYSWFFSSLPNNNTEVDVARIRSQLASTSTDFFPKRDGTTSTLETPAITATQHAPIGIDIENYYVFSGQGVNEAQAFVSLERAKLTIQTVREMFPHRRISWYGWAPHNNWYAIKNWHSVKGNPAAANYASYKAAYNTWRKENTKVLKGGTSTRKNNLGPLGYCDILSPDLYMPNDTNYAGVTPWQDHSDCVQWAPYFRECVREAKRLYQKSVIPWISPYHGSNGTYFGDEFLTHMLDTAYATRGDTDGVIIYIDSGDGWDTWKELVRDWVTENIG